MFMLSHNLVQHFWLIIIFHCQMDSLSNGSKDYSMLNRSILIWRFSIAISFFTISSAIHFQYPIHSLTLRAGVRLYFVWQLAYMLVNILAFIEWSELKYIFYLILFFRCFMQNIISCDDYVGVTRACNLFACILALLHLQLLFIFFYLILCYFFPFYFSHRLSSFNSP